MSAPTAIVLTLNEEAHLPGCLRSLRMLTDDILVLDSGSNDRTIEIALRHGATVKHHPFSGYATQRNVALQLTSRSEWVVFLDADERLTPDVAAEIHSELGRAGDELAALWLPRRNVMFGRALRGGGWWPDYQARVLRRDRAYFDELRQVHETVVLSGASRHLTQPVMHLNYAGPREFLAKQRRYAELLARDQRGHGHLPRRRALVGAPLREFWRRYVRLQGYRDGTVGLFLASAMAADAARTTLLLRREITD